MVDDTHRRVAELVQEALQSARVEVVRRLLSAQLPLSVKIPRTVIEPWEGAGWRTAQQEIQVGTIYLDQVFYGIADQSVPHKLLGLREQLEPLADYLDSTTDLASRPWPRGPSGEGAEGILEHFLVPMAHSYLLSLKDLGEDDAPLIKLLGDELQQVIDQVDIYHRWQIVLSGLTVSSEYNHRDVSLRSLSPLERGILADFGTTERDQKVPGSDFEPPSSFTISLASTLLEITTKRTPKQPADFSTLPNRVALAFFLSGFEISSTGIMPNFDLPKWAAVGVAQNPFPLSERTLFEQKAISEGEFKAIVDLAYRIPEFGGRKLARGRTIPSTQSLWHELARVRLPRLHYRPGSRIAGQRSDRAVIQIQSLWRPVPERLA